MNAKLRVIIPLVVLALAGIGFVAHTGFGNLSALGWGSVSLLCPLGALGTMLASKTVVPRAVISLVIAVVAIIILGRAFCAWVCPVPVFSKLRGAFSKQPKKEKAAAEAADGAGKTEGAGKMQVAVDTASVAGVSATAVTSAATASAASATADTGKEGTNGTQTPTALSAKEKRVLKTACGHHACSPDCRPSNSRHLVLGSALLSAAIFGFPVFCLVCPIGLSFALVFVLINLFGAGDVTWSVIAIPALLLVEVVFFRKWCSHICPLSALMSLISKANRTLRPTIDNMHCIEAHGKECGRCGQVCEVGIDPRHPELGTSWSECTKCRACIDACPGGAISMPLLPRKQEPLPELASDEKRRRE